MIRTGDPATVFPRRPTSINADDVAQSWASRVIGPNECLSGNRNGYWGALSTAQALKNQDKT